MPQPLLVPGRTAWRVERCPRAAVLIDGSSCFGAMRSAFLAARRTIYVVGWDIDSRTELVGAAPPTDGLPTAFGPFLVELLARKPELRVHLLLWDYSLVYAYEREKLPRLHLDWEMPPQVSFRLDNTVAFGSSQHQKLVIVDDTLAFSGGLDLTIRRWDTPRHEVDQPGRVDPDGKPYNPFHDVQMMVDGAAGQALAVLAHDRWCRAGDEGEAAIAPEGDPWPPDVVPDFRDVDIGISRTQPRFRNEEPAYEVERLFLDSLECAERTIYIENQFATSSPFAARLAACLRQNPDLEVVIVAPHAHESLLESRTMRNGRIRFWRTVRAAGGNRVRLVSPAVTRGGRSVDVMIHSKVMVIDDRFLRIGSANLNNRSMGADTECDLSIEAANDEQRAAIAAVRDRLLGEHCGVAAEDVAEVLKRDPSIVRLVDTLSRNGHGLRPIDDGRLDRNLLSRLAERVADPRRPLRLSRLMGHLLPRLLARRRSPRRDHAARTSGASGSDAPARGASESGHGARFLLPIAMIVGLVVLTLAWNFTSLSDYADPRRIQSLLNLDASSPLAPLLVVGGFVLAGCVAFPVIILILVTGAVFGPWLGMAYAAAGVAASAAVFYAVGNWLGSEQLRRVAGSRWPRLSRWLKRRGLLAVVGLRVLPMAPFSVVNLAIGASGIGVADFALGTLIGMAPGLVAMSFVGDRLLEIVQNPSASQLAWLALAVGTWMAVAVGAQVLVSRLGGRDGRDGA
ncbi:MAG: VTT domain-containing protein [Enhydrobacter sp.]|nr:VTT domain-containing protein [Enhydrobacter sp.]